MCATHSIRGIRLTGNRMPLRHRSTAAHAGTTRAQSKQRPRRRRLSGNSGPGQNSVRLKLIGYWPYAPSPSGDQSLRRSNTRLEIRRGCHPRSHTMPGVAPTWRSAAFGAGLNRKAPRTPVSRTPWLLRGQHRHRLRTSPGSKESRSGEKDWRNDQTYPAEALRWKQAV
jgi:hypothetical protein